MRLVVTPLVASLVLGLALAGPATAAAQGHRSARARRVAARRAPRFPAVSLYHVNHRETMRYRPYDAKGRVRKAELKRFNRFMRDGSGKGGRVGKMHPRLATLFYRVARHFAEKGKRVEVISGYRPNARNPRSPHRKGLAVDFRVKGVANAALRDYLRKTYDKVGVGYYPNSVFVHFDVRQRNAFWIDYSGPGEDAVYASDPVADLKSGRADTYKPSKERKPVGDDDAGKQAGEDSPPPDVETREPPHKAEPAPGEEGNAAAEKPAAEAEPKSAAKAEPKPAAKAEPKPAAKAEPKSAPKAEPKSAAKAEPKSAPKAEPKPAAKAEPKPAAKGEAKPTVPEKKSDDKKPAE